jgi:hypothetical protein
MLSPDGATVYDAVNGINWLADANLAATNRFGLPVCTASGAQPCVNASGLMNYAAAAAWVQAMNAANYLGHNNWQLPTTPPLDRGCGKTGPNGNSVGFGCTASALGSLFYSTSTVRSRREQLQPNAGQIQPDGGNRQRHDRECSTSHVGSAFRGCRRASPGDRRLIEDTNSRAEARLQPRKADPTGLRITQHV